MVAYHIRKHIFLTLFFGINLLAWGQNDDITYHQAPNTAQNEPKKKTNTDYLERISVGGTVGLQMGTGYIFIELSPHAAYHFNDYFCAGVGGTYLFYREKYLNLNYTTHVFGPTVFAEAHFLSYLGVHIAYQALNYEKSIYPIEKQRIWSNNLCMGGDYYQRTGRLAFYFYALYNLSDRQEDNLYNGPLLFKTGFSVFLK